MIRISVIVPVRSNMKAFYDLMESLLATTACPEEIEVLAAHDEDDKVFLHHTDCLIDEFGFFNLRFFEQERSEHFSKDYWNYLAKKAQGRFIINVALGCRFKTQKWDRIVYKKMHEHSKVVGDDLIHGLIKDNIPRHGEDPKYPNFSCHPVVSREHVKALGYLFDERNWVWGCDQCVTILYKALNAQMNEQRIVSLVDVEIAADKDIHTTTKDDLLELSRQIGLPPLAQNLEAILNLLRLQNKSYQKFLRISQEHPFTYGEAEAWPEAEKLKAYIERKRK